MAYSHYEVDIDTKAPARALHSALTELQRAWSMLRNVRASMIQQKDSDTDFTSIAANYGYAGANAAAQETNAQASFAEIDSAYSNCDAAISQLLARHL